MSVRRPPTVNTMQWVLPNNKVNANLHSKSKNGDDSLFEDDEDLKLQYMERELELKRINEEIEKKSSEILQKIDKYHLKKPTLHYYDEAGQGDGHSLYGSDLSISYLTNGTVRPKSAGMPGKSAFPTIELSKAREFKNSDDSRLGAKYSPINDDWFHEYQNNFSKRPATAGGLPFSSTSESHTESSLRRAETAKPLEGIEEKHQARLQKATESVLKCIQSKLVNYEQRLADIHLQYRQKIQENTMLESKVKALEEDRKRLMKSVHALQSTTDKFSKSAETSKMNLNIKVQAFASLKKEMDRLKRDVKQKNGLVQSLQTRLDRLAEENRRLRSQSQSTQTNMKQQHNEDRSTMEELKQRVVQLEQQKTSLQNAIEKQSQLVKSLRSQKVTDILQMQRLKIDSEKCKLQSDNNELETS